MNRVFLIAFLSAFFYFQLSAQDFTDSNLPIVIINTDHGMEIPDDPRNLADMKIIYRGPGLMNYVSDQNTPGYLN